MRPRRGGIRVDDSFAREVLESLDDPDSGTRASLLEHPALSAMLRHQRLSGNRGATREALLARILESVRRGRPSSRVLDAWANREGELVECVDAAAPYLPPGAAFSGTVFLVVGYDIGAAAPPDIVLNVGHEHFRSAPSELGFYATHEAHHVGFLASRRAPELAGLDDPARLRDVIAFMTQLEGMAVHAAYPPRFERGCLDSDGDYRPYSDAAEARRITARYAALLETLVRTEPLSDEQVGTVLNAMSSGERIWYRFGALAAWNLERTRGRGALVESISDPSLFAQSVADLLRPA